MRTCVFCKSEISSNRTGNDCSNMCASDYARYEKRINQVHFNLLNKIYRSPAAMCERQIIDEMWEIWMA